MSDVGAAILGVSAILCVALVGYWRIFGTWVESRSKLLAEANEAAMQGREMLVQMAAPTPSRVREAPSAAAADLINQVFADERERLRAKVRELEKELERLYRERPGGASR